MDFSAQFLSPWSVMIYITVSAVLLFLVHHTRLAMLYIVKTAWVGFTIVAFLWVVISSMGSNYQYVQEPHRTIAQFFDPHSPATFFAGVVACAVVLAMVFVGRFFPRAQEGKPAQRRSRLILIIRVVMGLVAGAGLLVTAHLNGYDRWADNYITALLVARMGEYAVNSVLISVGAVVTSVCVGAMAAYALSKLNFFGRNTFLYTFIAGFAIPGQLILVPLFLMLRFWVIPAANFSFMDSRFGLALIYAAGDLPFTIFLLTGFFASLPTELAEAAAIDGCGEFGAFRKIFFPLAMPGLTTVAIFNFLSVWNEYNFALVFITNPKLKTLPVGLYTLNVSQHYAANWPALFAGIVVLWAPTFLIFLLLQKQIVAGLTLGSVKG